jgi:hypothetical protein
MSGAPSPLAKLAHARQLPVEVTTVRHAGQRILQGLTGERSPFLLEVSVGVA